ncbi:MAG: hypothetical protein ACM3UU_02990 [Ignavibacteriales bacterium]
MPYTGIEQDWDLEMADSNRINDFLKFYQQNDLSEYKKAAVMSIILASYNDFLNENDVEIDYRWNEIKSILDSKKIFFKDLINYWSLCNEVDDGNLFRITPLIRKIK